MKFVGSVLRMATSALVTSAFVSSALAAGYTVTPLVSDQPGVAPMTDPNLVNPWGISMGPTTPFWTANNGTGTATLYNLNGGNTFTVTPNPLIVTMPASAPITGTVFNATTDFVVSSGASSGAARFLFAAEDGTINGWNPNVPPPATSTQAQGAVSNPAAVYKGLAIGTVGTANFLYAANFKGKAINAFSGTFAPATLAGSFTDASVPADYGPFNVQNLGGKLYVTYAKTDPTSNDEVAGPGNGYVAVFDTNGNLLQHLASGGHLNAPWGLAMAPASFGTFANDLLVGNFGDGTINAFNPTTGAYVGTLSNAASNPLVISGLWALNFGNGGSGGDPGALYFTAGPGDEAHGLFGVVTVPEPSVLILLGLAPLALLRRRFRQA
jgi:uncharacterized protein (TIGR03118 family)